jgi:hypothetical protein
MLGILLSAPVFAVEVELWPETVFQVQQYRDVDQLRINKTRFTQYLTLNLIESAETPTHLFFASFRVDFDAGVDHSPDAMGNDISDGNFALLYAYYEARRLGDMADLTFGRQILMDELGFAPMDGLRITLQRNWHFGVEVYAGTAVKGLLSAQAPGLYLPNSDTHEPDGVTDDNRMTGLWGGALFLDGYRDTQLRLQARHQYSGETDALDMGLTFRQRILDIWNIYTIDSFSVLLERFTQLRIGTSVDIGYVGFRLEHDAWHAAFDGDSIFNFFNTNGQKELRLTVYGRPDDKTHLNGGYSRLTQNDGSIWFDTWGHDGNASHLLNLGLTRMLGDNADLRAEYRFGRGWGGDFHRMNLGGGAMVWNNRIRFEGDWFGTVYNRLTYIDILLGSGNKGFSWGLVGQTIFRIHDSINLTLRADVYSNDYIERQFAFYTLLDVHSWL